MCDRNALIHSAPSSRPQTVGEYFLQAGLARPGRAAVLREDECLTYENLALGAEDLARELAERGIGRGDRVVVECDPVPQAVVVLVACSRLGTVYVPVAPDAPQIRKAAIIEAVRPSAYAVAAGQEAAPGVPVHMYLSVGRVAVSGRVPGYPEHVLGAPRRMTLPT
ncbi:AMP-binding protein [Streptomyces eurocidicus]|uniref:Acyl-CoA synthetase (AMP-forming)/AMP-acid ligase II n=1 Tax=Streptomyces eurocidicus TaxID=66423 RepID=A0A7W8BH03_STREU|nr:AMP-binding protein [Streptomyces eurocidicus]MBB5123172.1 acyl-CoA synthetase (AMP-forming)/AMP-acid ligase II [Streptomyces eurocidicus]MBF6053815.1 AMP-binding protein [Streptomyces eurocidicus]